MSTHTHTDEVGSAAVEGCVRGRIHFSAPVFSVGVAFCVVIVLVGVAILLERNLAVVRVMQLFLAGFFLVFGAFKVRDVRGFARRYVGYDSIARHSSVYAHAYPFIELALGAAYFFAYMPLLVGAITATIVIADTVGVRTRLKDREQILSALIGTGHAVPLNWVTIAVNIVVASVAFAMIEIMLQTGLY